MNQDSVTLDISFETLVRAARKLSLAQKWRLVQSLQLPEVVTSPTRFELLAELEARNAAGAFLQVFNLRNRFAQTSNLELSDDQLMADIRTAATEWEKELDEFFGESI